MLTAPSARSSRARSMGVVVASGCVLAGVVGWLAAQFYWLMFVSLGLAAVSGFAVFLWAGRLERGLAELQRSMQRSLQQEDLATSAASGLRQDMPGELRALWQDWHKTQSAIARIFAAQREFTANAAHELKTPLAAMRLAGENLLRTRVEQDEVSETVGFLLEETARLNDLIERMLLLARAESGRIPIECDYLKLNPLLQQLHAHLLPLAEYHGQILLLDSPDDWSVWADAKLLRMAVENCVTNAIVHNPAGTRILLEVQRLAAGGICIHIRDNGTGIAVEDREYLFERFFRAAGSGSRGNGLGLPITKWAVAAFGGKVSFEPAAERGSTFSLLCPETEWDYFSDAMTESGTMGWAHPPDSYWVATAEPAQVLAALRSRKRGLSDAEVEQRRATVGSNSLRESELPDWTRHLWQVLRTPFNGILAICIVLSLLLNEYRPALIMALMIALSSLLRLWQERQSFKAIERLDDSVAVEAEVARADHAGPFKVDIEDLVPGDIVHLSPGAMVPADMRLLSSSHLTVTEVGVDGTLLSARKSAKSLDPAEFMQTADAKLSWANCVSAGTHVLAGNGTGVVLATGAKVARGALGSRTLAGRTVSSFEQGVRGVSVLLLTFMVVLMPLVFLLNGVVKSNWTESLLFALAVAVGLTPELLPMMVNVNLARAARQLAGKGLVIKSFSAVHNLGALDILCVASRSRSATLQPLQQCGVKLVVVDASPAENAQMVRALQADGNRVGVLAECLEHIPMMHAAQFSAVPAGSAPLLRDSADAVLQGEDPDLLRQAIMAARTAHGNLSKYVFITASSNFGNAFSVLLASVLLPFLPMRAVQLLAQNLLYDISQFFLPWDRVDESVHAKPQNWSPQRLRRFMLIFGPLSSAFDLLSFAVLWFVIGANSIEQQALFQTGWFMVGTVTQLTIIHVLRTGKIPFLHSRATVPISVATVVLMAVAISLPFSGVAAAFGFVALPWIYFLWLVAVVAAYALCAQLTKLWYIRRYGSWL